MAQNSLEKDEFDLELIQQQILGATIAIIAYIVLIISANQSREDILQRQMGIPVSDNLQPNEIAVISSFLVLTATIILANVAFTRLKEAEKSVESSSTNSNLVTSYTNIASGYSLSIIGNALRLLGNVQRANEQAK